MGEVFQADVISAVKRADRLLNAGLLVCYVLLLRFQMLHGGVYQLQLLLRGAGQLLDTTDISLPFFKYRRRKNVPAFEKAGTP